MHKLGYPKQNPGESEHALLMSCMKVAKRLSMKHKSKHLDARADSLRVISPRRPCYRGEFGLYNTRRNSSLRLVYESVDVVVRFNRSPCRRVPSCAVLWVCRGPRSRSGVRSWAAKASFPLSLGSAMGAPRAQGDGVQDPWSRLLWRRNVGEGRYS